MERATKRPRPRGQTTLEYLLILACICMFAGVAGKGLEEAVGKILIPIPKFVEGR